MAGIILLLILATLIAATALELYRLWVTVKELRRAGKESPQP